MTNNKYITDMHTHSHTCTHATHAHTSKHTHTYMWKHMHLSAHIHRNSSFCYSNVFCLSCNHSNTSHHHDDNVHIFLWISISELPSPSCCLSVCASVWLCDFSPLLSVIFHYLFYHWVTWVHGVTKAAAWNTWEPRDNESRSVLWTSTQRPNDKVLCFVLNKVQRTERWHVSIESNICINRRRYIYLFPRLSWSGSQHTALLRVGLLTCKFMFMFMILGYSFFLWCS